MNVVIGNTLADAREFATKWGIDSPYLISPLSLNARVAGLRAGVLFTSPAAFEHAWIRPAVQTVQRVMHRRGSDDP